MAYVDLNPIRAKMADKPETSDHTSAKKRIQNIKSERKQPYALMPFVGNPRESMPEGLPFHLTDYLELLGRSFASCDHGIRASMHIIGRAALYAVTNEEQLTVPYRLFSTA